MVTAISLRYTFELNLKTAPYFGKNVQGPLTELSFTSDSKFRLYSHPHLKGQLSFKDAEMSFAIFKASRSQPML